MTAAEQRAGIAAGKRRVACRLDAGEAACREKKTVVPRMAIPGVGWLAYCADPDGNTFGPLQEDAAAR